MAEQSQGDSTDQNQDPRDAWHGARDTGAAGAQDSAGTTGQAAEETFTQAQVDHFIRERLNRQKAQYADYDAIKERAAKLDEIEAANKSELEKATERIAALEQSEKAAAEQAREAALRATVVAEAAKRKFNDPDDALALIRQAVEFDGQGNPTNIAEAMDSLLQAKPYLVGGGARPHGADQGAREGRADQLTRADLQTMAAAGKTAEIVKAQAEGRLDTLMRGDT